MGAVKAPDLALPHPSYKSLVSTEPQFSLIKWEHEQNRPFSISEMVK